MLLGSIYLSHSRLRVIGLMLGLAAAVALGWPMRAAGQLVDSWQRRYAGPRTNGFDAGQKILVDRNGDLLVSGASATSATVNNTYLAKYAAGDGHILWAIRTTKNDSLPLMALDSAGDVILAGMLVLPSNNGDTYVAKFSGVNGSLLWQYTYTSAGNRLDYAKAVTIHPGGDVLMTSTSLLNDSSPQDSEGYTARLRSADGQVVWQQHYNPTTNVEDPTAIALDAAGNVFVGGTAYSTRSGNISPFILKYSASGGAPIWTKTEFQFPGAGVQGLAVNSAGDVVTSSSAYINTPYFTTQKYRGTDGTLLWRTGLVSNSGLGTTVATLFDSQGNVITTGYTRRTATDVDFYTAKYGAADGKVIWEKYFDGGTPNIGLIRDDAPLALALDADDNAVVVGYSNDASSGQPDYMLIKYATADGAAIWQKRAGNLGGDVANSVALVPGLVFVTGESDNTGLDPDFLTLAFRDGSTPVIANQSVTQISSSGATLGASVNPSTWRTSVVYEYGLTPEYGQVTSPAIAIGNGNKAVNTSNSITGLSGHTKYFFRARATNAVGGSVGTGSAFTTLNRAPAAQNDRIHSVTGKEIVFDPRVNDADPDNDALTVSAVSDGANGTVTTDGALIHYSGGPRFNGNDSFTYTVQDGFGGTATATVTLSNALPNARDQTVHLQLRANGSADVDVSTLIGDDDHDPLFISSVTEPQNGGVTFSGQTLAYTAGAGFTGNDTFTYTVSDGAGGSATGKIVLANSVPTAALRVLHPSFGPGGTLTLDITSNLADSDGDELAIISVSPGTYGDVTFAGMAITYGPTAAGFAGRDHFAYTINDGHGGSATGEIALTNGGPFAQEDAFILQRGVTTLDVLGNDSDPEGDALTISAVSSGAHGTVSTDGRTVTYLPSVDFEGVDSFTYTITDGRGATASASDTIKAAFPADRDLAEEGSAIPGMAGATWGRFGIPSVTAEGTVSGWRATYRIASRTSEGIFSGPIGQPALLLREGGEAANASGAPLKGISFRHFQQPVFSGSDFAVIAKVSGRSVTSENDAGIWVGGIGKLREIARTNALAPGTPGAGTAGARFRRFDSVAMPAPGIVFFRGKLNQKSARLSNQGIWVYEQGFLFFRAKPRPVPDRVDETNDEGLWVWSDSTGAQLVLREGQTFDFGAGATQLKSFRLLDPVNGSGGHARYDSTSGRLDALLSFKNGSSMVAGIGLNGNITPVRITGTVDTEDRVALSFGMPSSPGNEELPVSIATFRQKGSHKPPYATVFDFERQVSIAQQGMPAPGADGAVFRAFRDPVAGLGFGGVKVVAFRATLSGAEPAENTGLWTATYTGDTSFLSLIAREGAEAPGMPGQTFTSFESLSILEGRGAIFTARVARATGATSDDSIRGCWAICSDGTLQLMFREGAVSKSKTLRSFSLLTSVPGSYGQRRSWAAGDLSPSLIYRADWTDNTESIVTVAIP